jgi:MoxR-like ATPase
LQAERAADLLKALRDEVGRVVVGQAGLVDGLLIGLLAGGHVLVEGVPGLAKTTAVRSLAQALGLGFRRIQFTPDLLPGDLIGTQVFVPESRTFSVRRGPIFAPVVLADEINRAPAKVQSALLEAMEERQVTIGDETFGLPDPFLVMATQNPIDLEGTYPLPEAQVDRFLLKVVVPYPRRTRSARSWRATSASARRCAPSPTPRRWRACARSRAPSTSRRRWPSTRCGSRARRASPRSRAPCSPRPRPGPRPARWRWARRRGRRSSSCAPRGRARCSTDGASRRPTT